MRLISEIIQKLGVDELSPPIDIDNLCMRGGISRIVRQDLGDVSGMLVPSREGPVVVLNDRHTLVRQRFSCAHELAHHLIEQMNRKIGASSRAKIETRNRRAAWPGKERLCDRIAAELLMPRQAFHRAADKVGWSLKSLKRLANVFHTSLIATAVRLTSLHTEPVVLSYWKPTALGPLPQLKCSWSNQNSRCGRVRYGVTQQSAKLASLPVHRAFKTDSVEYGFTRLIVRSGKSWKMQDFPTEAIAFRHGKAKSVLALHFISRQLSEEMHAVKAIVDARPFIR